MDHVALRVALAVITPSVVFTDEIRRLHAALLRDAIRHARLTMDQASREAEIDPAQFQRQIEMAEGSHKRLAMLPIDVWQWYGVAILTRFGLPKELRVARKLSRVLAHRKRMAKASAPLRKTVAS